MTLADPSRALVYPLQFDEVAELDPFTGTDSVVNMDADGCTLLLSDES